MLNKNAPASLKKYSRIALTGTIIFCVISTTLYASGLTLVLPGIHLLAEAIGGIITTWAFVKQPHLAYILPFKVMRLFVIDSRNGIDIFDHAWIQEGASVESTLLSGMLQGINSLFQESFQRGNLKEIIMDLGVLMLAVAERSPIIVALFTTKSSCSLRYSLSMFTNAFTSKYKKTIDQGAHEQSVFGDAIELVKECFPYIPDYK